MAKVHRVGQGTQRLRNKGGAPTWHGQGTPREEPHGGARARGTEAGGVTQQQKTSVVVLCLHARRGVKINTKKQSKEAGRPPEKPK